MASGKINVSVENIFPLIKKFLYSDHEIFLRELVSNATDATLKLKHLTSIGEAKVEYGNPIIEVKIDKEGKKLHIIDQGLGMTADEVEKYINQVAFSGAEEFLEKYKDSAKDSGIIGHFGLGFYSAFMVAEKVEIITKSYKDEPAAHWTCDGSPEFTLVPHDKTERGSEIILHIAEDSLEFLEEFKIRELLTKYNKFMPVPIKFGTKQEALPKPEDAGDDYGSTDAMWSSSTDRFTPTVAGKYYVYTLCSINSLSPSNVSLYLLAIRKNGGSLTQGVIDYRNVSNGYVAGQYCGLVVDMNGSSDYLEVFGHIDNSNSASMQFQGSEQENFFGAYKVIGA